LLFASVDVGYWLGYKQGVCAHRCVIQSHIVDVLVTSQQPDTPIAYTNRIELKKEENI